MKRAIYINTYICNIHNTYMHNNILFTVAKTWNQPKCPSIYKRIETSWNIYSQILLYPEPGCLLLSLHLQALAEIHHGSGVFICLHGPYLVRYVYPGRFTADLVAGSEHSREGSSLQKGVKASPLIPLTS